MALVKEKVIKIYSNTHLKWRQVSEDGIPGIARWLEISWCGIWTL